MYDLNSRTISLGLGVLGFGLSLWACFKIKQTHDILGQSIENLSAKTTVDVEGLITQAALERSLDRAVDHKVEQLSRRITRSVEDDMHSQVRGAITRSYADVEKSVKDEVAAQVSRINIEHLKTEVRSSATEYIWSEKEAILSKFDGNLDDILGGFNNQLEQVTKIYGSIANTLNPKS